MHVEEQGFVDEETTQDIEAEKQADKKRTSSPTSSCHKRRRSRARSKVNRQLFPSTVNASVAFSGPPSLVSQGSHGIDTHSAACGDVAREQRYGKKQQGHASKVTGSRALTPKSRLAISHSPNDASRPIRTPAEASFMPWYTTKRSTSLRWVPSATRIPISLILCTTAYDVTP